MIKLSPSLLAADAACLGDEVRKVAEAGCEELHFDVMDAHFVPNLTFGPHILAALKPLTSLTLDVHLMLSDPLSMLDPFIQAGADIITVHVEAENCLQSLRRIRQAGLQSGVSLRPGTDVSTLADCLPLCDRVLIMTVEPGFGGQAMQPQALEKARQLREMGFKGDIEVDGGIKPANMQQAVACGCNVLVMGTAFFGSDDPVLLAQQVHAL